MGETDAAPLTYCKYDATVNAMEVALDLRKKGDVMIPLQENELGGKIEPEPEEVSAIVAFPARPEEKARFVRDETPANILAIIAKDDG